MLKFKEILGYITWSSSSERERERKKERGGVNSFMAFVHVLDTLVLTFKPTSKV